MRRSVRHADGGAMASSPQFGGEDPEAGADRALAGRGGQGVAVEGTNFSFEAPRRSASTVDSRLDTVRSRLREMMAAQDESSDGSGCESRGAKARSSATAERVGLAAPSSRGTTPERRPSTVPRQPSRDDNLTVGTRVVGRDGCAKVGLRVCIIDPSIARFVEPMGSIVEVRCGGERVQVEHDGPEKQRRYYNTGKGNEYQLTFVDGTNPTGVAEEAPSPKPASSSGRAEAPGSLPTASTYAERRRSSAVPVAATPNTTDAQPGAKAGIMYAERRRSSAGGLQPHLFSQAVPGEAEAAIATSAGPGSRYAERRRSSTSVSQPILSLQATGEEAEVAIVASGSVKSKYAERRRSSAIALESNPLAREVQGDADVATGTSSGSGIMYAEKRRSSARAPTADQPHIVPKPSAESGTGTGSSYAARRRSSVGQQAADVLPPPAPWEDEAQTEARATAGSNYAERRRSSAAPSQPLQRKPEAASEAAAGTGSTYAERRRSSVGSPISSLSTPAAHGEVGGHAGDDAAHSSRSCRSRSARGSLPAPPADLPADVSTKRPSPSLGLERAPISATCSDTCEASADSEADVRRTARRAKAKLWEAQLTGSRSVHTGSPESAVSSGFHREEHGRLRPQSAKPSQGPADLEGEDMGDMPWNRSKPKPHDDDSGSDTDTGFAPACKSVLSARGGSRALPENKSLNDMKSHNVAGPMPDPYNHCPPRLAPASKNADVDFARLGLDKLQQDHEDIAGRLRSVEDGFSRNVISLRKELREWVDDSEKRMLARMFEEVDRQIRQAASTAVSKMTAGGKYSLEPSRDDMATSLNEEPEQEVESEAGGMNKSRQMLSKEEARQSASSSPVSSAELADSTRRLEAIGCAARRVSASLDSGAAGTLRSSPELQNRERGLVPPSLPATDPCDPVEMSRLSQLRQFARGVLSGNPGAWHDQQLETLQAPSECSSVPTTAAPCAPLRDLASSSDARGALSQTPPQFGRPMPPQEFHIGSARGSRSSRSAELPRPPQGGGASGPSGRSGSYYSSTNTDLDSDGEYWQDSGADYVEPVSPPRRSTGGARRSSSSQWAAENRGGGRSARRQGSVSAGTAHRGPRGQLGGESWGGAPGGQAQGWGMIF